MLGSLVEKELTTPEYYPLSLNALVNACNQKSNRDPAMSLDEEAVRDALRSLEKHGLAGPADNMVSRVSKYEHRLQEAYNFTRHETAILAELLLRGPQTPGELRSRADRMHKFDDLGIVQSTLQRLMKREPPLAKLLPRQPGNEGSALRAFVERRRGSSAAGILNQRRGAEQHKRQRPDHAPRGPGRKPSIRN